MSCLRLAFFERVPRVWQNLDSYYPTLSVDIPQSVPSSAAPDFIQVNWIQREVDSARVRGRASRVWRRAAIATTPQATGTNPRTAAEMRNSTRIPNEAARNPPSNGPAPNPNDEAAPIIPNAAPFDCLGLAAAAHDPTRANSPP